MELFFFSPSEKAHFIDKFIMKLQNENFSSYFIIYIYIYIYIYIVIHRQTFPSYHDASVCPDTQDAPSWDRNPPKFIMDLVSNSSATGDIHQLPNCNAYVVALTCFKFCLIGYQHALFARIELRRWKPLILSPDVSTIYIYIYDVPSVIF